MKKRYFLDANIFLRFLTGDDKRKADACLKLVKKAVEGEVGLRTHPLILAEVVWVLESYYGLQRYDISAKLDLILNTPNLEVSDADSFIQAVEIYSNSNLDLADCFAAALSLREDSMIVSYDRDFDKVGGVVRVEPGEV